MYYKTTEYMNDMEILDTGANLVCFTTTVLASNVKDADENGKKYVPLGSLIDTAGKVVTEKKVGENYELSSMPIGVLYNTADVTNNDVACSYVVEGYLRADRVLEGFANTIELVKEALPKITFR
ncbi:hypothetical protein [Metaclostridioides mangenotii]|uniref:hypothetical protein n=1 Tax=Metaclostridioides mangenotii TaxID=1540 RepID=UPI00056E3D46|nr:hypothetical protein [Clostridioides mangenotii]